MKARKVAGLEPDGTLADNAERIVRERLDELCAFMPTAGDPSEVEALHDMRIAAKRLRYVLELTAPCFGSYARTATRHVRDLQDLLGEIHDCDEQIPAVRAAAARLIGEDATALARLAEGEDDADPALLRRVPHRREHAGLAALETHLRGRRAVLFARFAHAWSELERKGFSARLEYAVTERPEP